MSDATETVATKYTDMDSHALLSALGDDAMQWAVAFNPRVASWRMWLLGWLTQRRGVGLTGAWATQ